MREEDYCFRVKYICHTPFCELCFVFFHQFCFHFPFYFWLVTHPLPTCFPAPVIPCPLPNVSHLCLVISPLCALPSVCPVLLASSSLLFTTSDLANLLVFPLVFIPVYLVQICFCAFVPQFDTCVLTSFFFIHSLCSCFCAAA